MSIKLRELIRLVRQCKSASEERSVISKELAAIRTAFRDKSKLEYRHRNVAKLMYVDMLGYPTHFGQVEVLKLLSSPSYPEKRLGYLALMQLLDENTEVLMLATQSLKKDIGNENPFIVGLSLCAFGNIASTDIARDLGNELEKILKHPNPYIRKKALCTAIRVVTRVPDMCDEYFKVATQTLEDNSQGNGPMVAAVQLLTVICRRKKKYCKKLRKYSNHIITRLNGLLRSTYDPDHDIGGVTDPFLQVHLLQLLRLISVGDKKITEEVDSTLANIATNTESNKNPGNSILYECVRTIMSIEKQSSLHVLAINILGRFLVNRDNNVRYVALNALCNAVQSNTQAIQRHRNTIVECLKDADLSIRKRALELVYALTNKKNIKSLTKDLLGFLILTSTTEMDFKHELASKICMIVEQYSPTRKWHFDTIIQVLSTVPNFNRNGTVSGLYILISNTPDIQNYCVYKLFNIIKKTNKSNLASLPINSDGLKRLAAWCFGEYCKKLTSNKCANDAINVQNDDIDDNKTSSNPNNDDISSNSFIKDKIDFKPKDVDDIISKIKIILNHDKSSDTVKGYCLTALMKILHQFGDDYEDKIRELIDKHQECVAIELQQRSVEYQSLFDNTNNRIRSEILKPMPLPEMKSIIEEEKSEPSDISDNDNDDDSDDDNDDNSDDNDNTDDNSDDDSDDDNSDDDNNDDDSDDDSEEERRHRKKHLSKKQKHSSSKKQIKNNKSKKRSKKNKVIPTLSPPGSSNNNKTNGNVTNGNSRKSNNNNNNNGSNNNNSGDIDDLLGGILGSGLGSNNNNNNGNSNNNNNDGFNIDTILNMGDSNNNNSNNNNRKNNNNNSNKGNNNGIPPLTAFAKDGVTCIFNFAKTQKPGVTRISATFSNSTTDRINEFAFLVAVPKYIKLQIKPANGNILQGMNGNKINQKFQLTNNQHGNKPLMIKIQISYKKNGNKVTEIDQVKFPSNVTQ